MRTRLLGGGLFFLTFATLLLEVLDARLLSVLTWYHLSFFAISLAMLGMAAGAVFVFVHPDYFDADRAPLSLARVTFALACAIPLSHALNLSIPFLTITDFSVMEVVSVASSTVVLAVPFVLSGIAVTVALTRCGGSIGVLYALDLSGAATACVLVVPLLDRSNVSSAIAVAAGAAAVAAACFYRLAGSRGALKSGVLAVAVLTVGVVNSTSDEFLRVIYPKNRQLWLSGSRNARTEWNSHSYVIVQPPVEEPAFLWGPGEGAERLRARIAWLAIDGEAGTPITQWNGDVDALGWVSYDVTSLPYALRHGDVAVIGPGGGRDLLAAIWGRNRSIVGVDVNGIMIELLTGSYRSFANIANRHEVSLVHDDGRAFITRSAKTFDVIQMSLVDTWAATGAGAFTLSENGLYTREAWRQFLNHLSPGGVLSVSRWFDPRNVSEASRLLALGVASLIDRGVARPIDHLLLVVRGRVATLLVSNAPWTAEDRAIVSRVAAERKFELAVTPWGDVRGARLNRIAESATHDELERAIADPYFDYSAPTDRRPYYFNMLKPRAFLAGSDVPRGGALEGNLRATGTLLVLFGVATVLVIGVVAWPLVRFGRPPMPAGQFATSMSYFAIIGFAYMLVQIALLQRLSVYLGHPTYTLAIVLFSMLLFTGLGAFASDRVTTGRFRGVPAAIAVMLAAIALGLSLVTSATIAAGLVNRTLIVLSIVGPLSLLLGTCFPLGVRLVAHRPGVVPWAWGVNGALSVLASIAAVIVSIWVQIDANFWLAAALYLGLLGPLRAMTRWAGVPDHRV
jgi:SAM-dependent methyltransferase